MTKLKKMFSSLMHHARSSNFSIEHIVFLWGAAAGTILSAIGVIGNHAMNLHWLSVVIPLINLVLDVSCGVYSIVTKKWRGAARVVFLFVSFVMFPMLWFTTGGTMSSSLPLIIGLGVVLALIFRGKFRVFIFSATLVLYSTLIIVELYNPGNFIPYPNRESLYIDVLIGFVLSFLASGSIAYYSIERYNAAKSKSEALVQQLETLSVTDVLTGAYNRRHLMVRLDDEMRKAFDSGEQLSLCIIDIDHFKNVNDTYGHVYGDEVLQKTSRTIMDTLGENEIFGRYGGEEFVVIFMNRNVQDALEIVNNCFEALRNINWSHGTPITVSVGMAAYTKGLSYSKFLADADANLYKAKRNGRDRVEY